MLLNMNIGVTMATGLFFPQKAVLFLLFSLWELGKRGVVLRTDKYGWQVQKLHEKLCNIHREECKTILLLFYWMFGNLRSFEPWNTVSKVILLPEWGTWYGFINHVSLSLSAGNIQTGSFHNSQVGIPLVPSTYHFLLLLD